MMKYVFYPLSFTWRQYGKPGLIISILTTFLIIGWWHGANLTFLVFGLLHGLYFIPLIVNGKISSSQKSRGAGAVPTRNEALRMVGLCLLVMLTVIVFGSDSILHAVGYLRDLFSLTIFDKPVFTGTGSSWRALMTLFFICVLLTVEWIQRNRSYELQIEGIKNRRIRLRLYYAIVLSIILCGSVVHLDFIYAQF